MTGFFRPFGEPAECITLYELAYSSDYDSIWVLGRWRGSYSGRDGYAVELNETMAVVTVGVYGSSPDPGCVEFVSMEDIEEGRYWASPIAVWSSENPVLDLLWTGNYLYVACCDVVVLDVSDLFGGCPVEVGRYSGSVAPHVADKIVVDGNIIYAADWRGNLCIYEFDTTMSVGQDGYSLREGDINPFPNPLTGDERIVLGGRFSVFDLSGKLVLSGQDVLDASRLAPGMYLLSTRVGKRRVTQKILVVD